MIKRTAKYFYNKEKDCIETVSTLSIIGIPVYTTTMTSNYPSDIESIKGNKNEDKQSKIGFK